MIIRKKLLIRANKKPLVPNLDLGFYYENYLRNWYIPFFRKCPPYKNVYKSPAVREFYQWTTAARASTKSDKFTLFVSYLYAAKSI